MGYIYLFLALNQAFLTEDKYDNSKNDNGNKDNVNNDNYDYSIIDA